MFGCVYELEADRSSSVFTGQGQRFVRVPWEVFGLTNELN